MSKTILFAWAPETTNDSFNLVEKVHPLVMLY